jgi:hypothetical protein
MLEIALIDDDVLTYGYSDQASRKQAESHLPELREYAQTKAARLGIEPTVEEGFEIKLIQHSKECTGGCPDTFGLQHGCKILASYPILEG